MMNPKHNKKRHFESKLSLHVVLKAKLNLFNNSRARQMIDSLILKYATYFEVNVYHRAIVSDHIHLILKSESKDNLSGFLRVLSAQISLKFRQKKILPQDFSNIWLKRPWSEVLKWGKRYGTAIQYVALNYLEGMNVIKRTKKKGELAYYSHPIKKVLTQNLTKLIKTPVQLSLAV